MRKNNKTILLFALAIAAFYVILKKLNAKYHFTNADEKVSVKKGQTFELEFPFNVSSGPTQWWILENEKDIDIVEKIGDRYQSNVPIEMSGGGGTMFFKYKAVKEGTQTMRWTIGKGTYAEKTRTIGISVI